MNAANAPRALYTHTHTCLGRYGVTCRVICARPVHVYATHTYYSTTLEPLTRSGAPGHQRNLGPLLYTEYIIPGLAKQRQHTCITAPRSQAPHLPPAFLLDTYADIAAETQQACRAVTQQGKADTCSLAQPRQEDRRHINVRRLSCTKPPHDRNRRTPQPHLPARFLNQCTELHSDGFTQMCTNK